MPDTPVVSISGDEALLFTAMEMATAAQHRQSASSPCVQRGAYGNVTHPSASLQHSHHRIYLRISGFREYWGKLWQRAERVKSPENSAPR